MRLVGEGLATAPPGETVDIAVLARAAVKRALLQIGSAPNLAFVFVATDDAEDAERALLIVDESLPKATTLGVSAAGVLGVGKVTDGTPGVAVWVARFPGLRARTFHLEVIPGPDEHEVVGLPGRRRDDVMAIVFSDPWSFPTADFVAHASELLAGLPVAGAVASGPPPARTTRLLLDGRIHHRGAAGIMLGGQVQLLTLVSPGCRPVGPVLTVTESEGFLIRGLAGSPASTTAREIMSGLDDEDLALAMNGLFLGVAVPGAGDDLRMGDFVVHEAHYSDVEAAALHVGVPVPTGATVQFHIRDDEAADRDLQVILEGLSARLHEHLMGALLFTSTARARFMFDSADHDAALARERLGVPVVGFVADGEIAPLRGSPRLNNYSATVVGFAAGARVTPGHGEIQRPQQLEEVDEVQLEVRKLLADLAHPPDDGIL